MAQRLPLPLLLILATGCPASCPTPDRFTGKPHLPVPADNLDLEYREFAAEGSRQGDVVLYTLRTQAQSDVLKLGVLSEPGEWAHDDARHGDLYPADGEYTGEYLVRERRQSPSWGLIIRGKLGEYGPVKVLPPADEVRRPPLARKWLAGGPGGDHDHASVCPPAYVLTGIKARVDQAGRSIGQIAPVCRALRRTVDGKAVSVAAHRVDGPSWGDDQQSAQSITECPAGHAVVAAGEVRIGRWNTFNVVVGVRLACAAMEDPLRRTVKDLQVGFDGETGFPMRCAESEVIQPPPFAAGIRPVFGQRLDALGFLCDAAPDAEPRPVREVSFDSQPSSSWRLQWPVRPVDPASGVVTVTSLGRLSRVRAGVLELPMADARLEVLSPAEAELRPMAEGCVLEASAQRIRLGHGPGACDAAKVPVFAVEFSGGTFASLPAGSAVNTEQVLARVAAGSKLRLRVLAASAGVDPRAPEWPNTGLVGDSAVSHVLRLRLPGSAEVKPTTPAADGGQGQANAPK